MNRITSLAVAGLITLAACQEAPVGVSIDARSSAAPEFKNVSIMSQNLYVGADVDAVIGALASSDPTDDFPALFAAIQTFEETDYAARMSAVADRIARVRPHAVGLQEVSIVDIDLTGYGVPVVIHADFLPALMQALNARGVHYSVAATVKNLEAVPIPGIRLVDYDVLLVDTDRVTVQSAGGRTFLVNLGVVAQGVDLKRGWVWASTTIDERPYYFASTHLEGSAAGMPEVLAAQASELAAFLPTDRPVIVVGDFNDRPGSLMYQAMTKGGFTDVWATLNPGTAGYTCCNPSDLSNGTAAFSTRIDYVFARDVSHPQFATRSGIVIQGDGAGDRIDGPYHQVWPSDHAGLHASLSKLRADDR